MPKKRFFNLTEEKRERFLEASMFEFTTKSFEQVSVNSIIKKANISRGAFYTYFEDLDSLFNYIFFDSIKREKLQQGKKIIKTIDGDFFLFIKTLFEYDYDKFSEKGRYSLFRNYIHYIQQTKKGSIREHFSAIAMQEFPEYSDIRSVFDYPSLNLNLEEFLDLVEVTVVIIVNTFLKSETENLSKEEVFRVFNRRLKFLEYGLKKEDKK